MYLLSKEDIDILELSEKEVQYINLLLKHAYEKGYRTSSLDTLEQFKKI